MRAVGTTPEVADSSMARQAQNEKPARSEKRRRNKVAHLRLSDAEYERLVTAADNAGMSLGAYLRACALGDAGPRAARKPPVAKRELIRLLGQIGKTGSNLNQLARAVNSGDDPNGLADDIKAAVVDYADMRAAVRKVLGLGP